MVVVCFETQYLSEGPGSYHIILSEDSRSRGLVLYPGSPEIDAGVLTA